MTASSQGELPLAAEQVRVRGLVQGVGFRPAVWRLARDCGLQGDVCNDGAGVLIRIWGPPRARERFCARLRQESPPLARIEEIIRSPLLGGAPDEFRIIPSRSSEVRTGVVPDAATCRQCHAEILDPSDRRFRYAFTNCTHCGPRLSIIRQIPYDRCNTSMAAFELCPRCRSEYADPANRRFHAQPNACPDCGPRVWLQDAAGREPEPTEFGDADALAAASRLLDQGLILAVKGIGGFHLACDATNAVAVNELRRRKRRYRKPFALMARDLEVVRRYCEVGEPEAVLLGDATAPIVLLQTGGPESVAPGVAPDQASLGFMLPYSPLHHLLLLTWDRPLVMTSGNLSEEPQCVDNADAAARLGGLADWLLLHDREIVNRLDDSVVQWVDGAPRLLRRARGFAPRPLSLPEGFAEAPQLLALGGELKSTFCLLMDGQAILSQHLGDLEDARTAAEFQRAIDLYLQLFQHQPRHLVVDRHADYHSSRVGRRWAERDGLPLQRVQHHHAHIASVLADTGWGLREGKVLGIALDGLGLGEDGTLWGGEFLVADYRDFHRVGWLLPVPMPGGTRAILEPWRNTYAQLRSCLGWDRVIRDWPQLELTQWLQSRPLEVIDGMLQRRLNCPLSSSCGRLFDAVAGALGIAREAISYEGEAAVALEALARRASPALAAGYPLKVDRRGAAWVLDPTPLWPLLLQDLRRGREPSQIALAFHLGLGAAISAMAATLARHHALSTVALSGGVFQNRLLFEAVSSELRSQRLRVLSHRQFPTNDGGLALGQATIAAARLLF